MYNFFGLSSDVKICWELFLRYFFIHRRLKTTSAEMEQTSLSWLSLEQGVVNRLSWQRSLIWLAIKLCPTLYRGRFCIAADVLISRDILISKVSSAIVINRLYSVSSDFIFSTYNGHSSHPCISHISSFLQNNLIAWKERPRCLHLKMKWALNSLLLFFSECGFNCIKIRFVMFFS